MRAPPSRALARKPSRRRARPQLTCEYGGAVERGASFSWEQDQKFVEKEIDRLFLLGCVTSERVLDIDSFRVVIHALDPFALESDIASMHREADLSARAVVH